MGEAVAAATVLYDVQDRVALVTLNRPDRLNAFTGEMATDLKGAVAEAVVDPAVRAIVLTGAGRAFCAGADMAALSNGASLDGDAEIVQRLDEAFVNWPGPDIVTATRRAGRFGYLMRSPKPVVAAINGSAVGLGMVLSLYADVRIAAEEAFFMTSFGQRGLIAEHGIAWLLSRLSGPSRAMDLLVSSRRVKAAEAEVMGLVSAVHPKDRLLPAALAYAGAIAHSISPRSVAVMKAQVWHATFGSFEDALTTALDETRLSVAHPDLAEGLRHFAEKRPPRFADL